MRIYLIVFLSALAYAIATKLSLAIVKENEKSALPIIPAATFGILCHVFTLFDVRHDIEQFGIMAMLSLLSLVITVFSLSQYVFNQYRLPVAIVTAFSALAVWLPFFIPASHINISNEWSRLHIVLAMTAYVLISFAGLYALLTIIQTRRLKHNVGLSAPETPLVVLEKLMVRATLLALLFLIMSLVVSWWFLSEEMTKRHQYKLLFGAISWVPLSFVLIRYYFQGFRGQKAAVWILVGTTIAFLGYFITGFMR